MTQRVKHRIGIELVRYLTAGLAVVTTQFSILSFLVEKVSLNPTISSGIAYVISTIINYLLQFHYTFRSQKSHCVILLRYFCVTAAAIILNTLIFWLCNEMAGLWYLFSQMVALVLVTAFNFLLGRHYTFG